jgi:hypothetical protein
MYSNQKANYGALLPPGKTAMALPPLLPVTIVLHSGLNQLSS